MKVCTLPYSVLSRTFDILRACGRGRCECQALWVSSWRAPDAIIDCVHPSHAAHAGGFVLDDAWLSRFWLELARRDCGVRVQVHTHPGAAFHSPTDDQFPIVHSVGFRSLVIPKFALGHVGFSGAYLCEIESDGGWRPLQVEKALKVIT